MVSQDAPSASGAATAGHPRVWILDEEWDSVDFETDRIHAHYPDAQVVHSGYSYRDDLESFGTTCDVILAQIYASLPGDTIGRLEHCRGIAVMGGGFDRVDVAEASARGIPVTNVQGYCAEDIAQYVMTAILTHVKPQVTALGPDGPRAWGLMAYPRLPRRAAGQTLLVVGYGRIGRTVARRARANGMRVVATDPHVPPEAMSADGVEKVEWEDGFAQADVVSLHCSLSPQTQGIVGAREFALMPADALLVNTSRGGVVDEGALVHALRAGVLGAAVLDVVAREPPNYAEDVFSAPRATVTPHVSYLSSESITELRSRSVDNALAMYRGEVPPDCVNVDAVMTSVLVSPTPNQRRE